MCGGLALARLYRAKIKPLGKKNGGDYISIFLFPLCFSSFFPSSPSSYNVLIRILGNNLSCLICSTHCAPTRQAKLLNGAGLSPSKAVIVWAFRK